MSLNPAISIDAVNNTGEMNLFNGINLFANYKFDNSDVTISAVATPTVISFSIFEANVVLVEKWITLIKENLDILWQASEEFTSNIQTISSGLNGSFKLMQFLSHLSYDILTDEFTILPVPSQTISFPIFDRWSKFLRRISSDARLFNQGKIGVIFQRKK